jgi:hypothetical protein
MMIWETAISLTTVRLAYYIPNKNSYHLLPLQTSAQNDYLGNNPEVVLLVRM